MKVKELMSRGVAAARPDAPLADAARMMWDRDCGFLCVIDPDTNELSGVLTDRDACMAAYTQGRPLGEIPVSVAMAALVVTCRDEDELQAAHALMRKHQVRRLPVVDQRRRLVGVISLSDLARRAPHESTGWRNDVAQTLAEISRTRVPANA